MRYEACDNSPQFYRVRGTNKALIDYLKYSVKSTLRYYEDGAWYVHISQILALTQLAYSTFGHVNYAVLPLEVQMQIAEEKNGWRRGEPKPPEWRQPEGVTRAQAYETLHLTPDAPEFILKAVWRALVKEHHPDKGGDEQTFKKYSAAYEKITG